VLGGFSLANGTGQPVTPRGLPGKAARVLAAAGVPLHVEQLAEALWEDAVAADRSRARLRNIIARTRVDERPAIKRDGDIVFLDPDITVDAVQFEDACTRALTASPDDALETSVAATSSRRIRTPSGRRCPADDPQPLITGAVRRPRRRALGSCPCAWPRAARRRRA
jgi:DNA-binding SARP family transcriptional activator